MRMSTNFFIFLFRIGPTGQAHPRYYFLDGHLAGPPILLFRIGPTGQATVGTTFLMAIWPVTPSLPNDPKAPRPPRFREEIGDEVGDLLEAIHNVGSTVFIRIRFIGPVNDEPFTDDELAGNEAPIPAVGAVVAIVPHGEVMVRGYDDLAVFRVLFIPIGILIATAEDSARVRLGREEITERIRVRTRRAFMNLIWFTERHVIDEQLLVHDFQPVSRKSDCALDIMFRQILGILKDYHIAPFDIL